MQKFRSYSRWFGRFTYRFFEVFFLIVATWALMSQLLPQFRLNGDFKPASNGIDIFIRSNGVHTDFVLPISNQVVDWNTVFNPKDFYAETNCSYIALGWGDKGFFLNTPTWGDLTFSTAFTAASGTGESAMHVEYINQHMRKTNTRVLQYTISKEQYRSLVLYIMSSFRGKNHKPIMIDHSGYGLHDRFFEATGQYSLFQTCNEWTGDGMEEAGLPVGVWTPLENGIMKQ